MKRHLYAIALASLGLACFTQPATARPEIASGDQLLTTDVDGCLARADQLITDLDVEFDQGTIDRTGYFEDGAFRILCYGAGDDSSLAIVFASHEQSPDVASNFIQMMLTELSQEEAASQQ
ncbi:hypothetical protein IQ254_19855 [Nodosilinea sp. LEGE 07088]|uniref:hypothetical protein n=1 Tax=Nodosilinea sp. LEGE 07088 TaxID=2777968 RepID=UPI001882CA05|nr:hypothetical protein [Nodosilinea sp. LEGE 07088]MBE9139423.1 hypothetical protein [Nodosilinea sp. LEGE 07088]